MARALSDIMTELETTYNPLRNRSQEVYNKGLDATNPQESADLGGLEQAKKNAFESINTGANRRGMFFSGIPLAEQGKYVGENYLPSVASLKNRYAGIRSNLYQTLAQQLGQYDLDQSKAARGIYDTEVSQDIEREKVAAARAAAAAGSGAFSPTLGGGSGATSSGTPAAGATASYTPTQALAAQNIKNLNYQNADQIRSDYTATLKSANYGNQVDIAKAEILRGLYPWLANVQAPVAETPTKGVAGAKAAVTKPVNTSNKGLYQQLISAFSF